MTERVNPGSDQDEASTRHIVKAEWLLLAGALASSHPCSGMRFVPPGGFWKLAPFRRFHLCPVVFEPELRSAFLQGTYPCGWEALTNFGQRKEISESKVGLNN